MRPIEAMHLLPQSFDFQMAHSSSQGTSVGTAALLLPVAVRFSKSLPHLLPRQAFSYPEPSLMPDRDRVRLFPRRVTHSIVPVFLWNRLGVPRRRLSQTLGLCRPKRRSVCQGAGSRFGAISAQQLTHRMCRFRE
ncbi:hypothetical protein E0H72_01880 [Rhizobium leguminosarum bv. viciae]|uniref:Uncharacterized protein n=1 Tax=Rhizobium leguminosarum TaxID=384 RepID=A0A7M3DIU5_RHILE|nr:hypothetical protein ELH90_37215 [Rhizobium leguminosarum]TCA47330.1 hypothetical protein E0H72_01880 [Rhizobium leguminosarum bv. viciae]